MKKWLKRIVLLAILAVFLYSVGSVAVKQFRYYQEEMNNREIANQFVSTQPPEEPEPSGGSDAPSVPSATQVSDPPANVAPVVVDFAGLRAVNEDVEGWLYCEGTNLNYPVLHGETNDEYLRHTYDGSYARGGSLFVDALNRDDFQDSNTIIYGHHIENNHTMFGDLEYWSDQEYYEEHPVIWLLTPQQDYKVEIMGCYTTPGRSDTYTVFRGPSIELDQYLSDKLAQSVIQTGVEPEKGARYVVFSTCSYDTEHGYYAPRFVVHGKLVPVDSAGGILKEE